MSSNGVEIDPEITQPADVVRRYIGAIDAVDFGTLGKCSERVLLAINAVHNTPSTHKGVHDVEIGDPEVGELTEKCQLNYFMQIPGKNEKWIFYVDATGEPGSTRQDIYFGNAKADETPKAIRLFTFLERANQDGCSVSLCWPATVDGIDWATVATKDDESRPVTIDQALSNIPQTNAEVLDSFFALVTGSGTTGLKDFINLLHLDILLARSFPKPIKADFSNIEFATIDPDSPHAELIRIFKEMGVLCRLSGSNIEKNWPLTKGRHLRFTLRTPQLTTVQEVATNLGTTERIRLLGNLTITDSDIVFIADNEAVPDDPDRTTEAFLELAERAFKAPEIVVIPELTQDIDELIRFVVSKHKPVKHADIFRQGLRSIFEKYKEQLPDQGSVLRIGEVDLSALGPGNYFDTRSIPNETKERQGQSIVLSIDLKASDDQRVFDFSFSGSADKFGLYRCRVDGAKRAFIGITNGNRLIAENCGEAFSNSNVRDSYARNVGEAFRADQRSASEWVKYVGCIAEDCDIAFTGKYSEKMLYPNGTVMGVWQKIKVHNSLAQGCRIAFHDIDEESRNLTAIDCKSSFRNPKSPKNTERSVYAVKLRYISKAQRKERSLSRR